MGTQIGSIRQGAIVPSKNRRPRQSAEYHKNRRLLLSDKPRCHWCQRRQATEADHLIEIDRGGSNALDNLVPACKQCNGRRGANYKAAKQRAKQAARPGAKQPARSQRAKPKRNQNFLDQGLNLNQRSLYFFHCSDLIRSCVSVVKVYSFK